MVESARPGSGAHGVREASTSRSSTSDRGDVGGEWPLFHHGVAALVVIAATFAAYSNALDGEFVFDDLGNIPSNPHIRMTDLDGSALWEAAFESRDPTRPVANVSLALNYYLGGYAVRGYHLFNVAVHTLNALLIYALALVSFRLSARSREAAFWPGARAPLPAMAALSALLFALHPVQTQAVSYVIQRMTSLAVLFYLVALLAWIVGRASPSTARRWTAWAVAALTGCLGLLSKPIAITLPLAIALYEWFFFQDMSRDWLRRHRTLLLGGLGIIVLAAGVAIAASGVLGGFERRDFSLGERILTQTRVVALYLSLVVLPHPGRLNLLHHIETSHSLLDPASTLLCGLLLLGLLAASVAGARRFRLVSFTLLWFFLQLAVESSVLPLEMIFEHRLYLPMVGLSLLGSYLLFSAVPNLPAFAWVAGAAALLLLGSYTHERNQAWQTRLALYSDAVEKSPRSWRAQYNLGNELLAASHLEEAAQRFAAAAVLNPGSPQVRTNLGVSLGRLGRLEEATRELEIAIALDPTLADAHHSLGTAFRAQGFDVEALDAYRTAVELGSVQAARDLEALETALSEAAP